METLLRDIFDNPRTVSKHTQVNKMRFIFKRSKADFDSALQLLRDNNFAVEQVKQLGNIMR